jgi:hypothetical protein
MANAGRSPSAVERLSGMRRAGNVVLSLGLQLLPPVRVDEALLLIVVLRSLKRLKANQQSRLKWSPRR